jgi:hypothetical protein
VDENVVLYGGVPCRMCSFRFGDQQKRTKE